MAPPQLLLKAAPLSLNDKAALFQRFRSHTVLCFSSCRNCRVQSIGNWKQKLRTSLVSSFGKDSFRPWLLATSSRAIYPEPSSSFHSTCPPSFASEQVQIHNSHSSYTHDAVGSLSGETVHRTARSKSSYWLLHLWPFLAFQWRTVVQAWFCTIVATVCLILIVPRAGTLSSLLSQGDLPGLARSAGFLSALVLLRAFAQFGQDALLWDAAFGLTQRLREHIFAHMQSLDLEAFEGRDGAPPVGDLAFRITSEADDAGATMFALLHALVPSTLQLLAMAGRMVFISPFLTIVTLTLLPVMSAVIAVLGERLRRSSRMGQDTIASLSAYLNEVFPAMLVVKAHGAEQWEGHRFASLAQADRRARLAKKRLKSLIPAVITAAYAATVLALMAGATMAIARGRLTSAGVVSFLTSLVLLIEPLQAVGGAYNEIKQGEPAVERLLELLRLAPKVLEARDAKDLVNVRGEVELRDVCFSFGGDQEVLRGLNLRVPAGGTAVIVGPSGSGKSTLLKLLLRLYDPSRGHVMLDGHDIRKYSLSSLRRHIGVVPQDTVLMTGTVIENIAYGQHPEDVQLAAVERAARLANAEDFIRALPQGYHTHLGERASALSGGQRQRLAIARAVYHEPSILILDEATSALDNQSERLVREALDRLMRDRTVIMVAHRLDRLKPDTHIVYLEEGRVMEEGNHKELISMDSKYAALYQKSHMAIVAAS